MTPGGELITAAQAADERGVSESRMRDLITDYGIESPSRQPGRAGKNLYPAEQIRAIPAPSRGQRSDLIGERIGRMFATARCIADTRGAGAVDEHGKLESLLLDGSPRAVPALLVASRRWAKRHPAKTAAALAEVEELATQLTELPSALSLRVREQIIIADAKARTATSPEETEENQS